MVFPDYSNYNQAAIPFYLKPSFAEMMIRYAPNGEAPLFGLTGMAPQEKASSVEHGYFAKTMIFPKVVISNGGAAYTSSTTTVVTTGTANIIVGDLLRSNATGEIVRVSSVVDTTTITIVRAFGQVAANASSVADGEVLYKVGNAFEQGSAAPASKLMNPARVVNLTQIFRNTWAQSRTNSALTPNVGGGLVAESRQDCGLFHSADIEQAMFFGQQFSGTVNNQFITAMDGIIETVRRYAPSSQTTVAGSTTNFTQLEAMLNGCFDVRTDARAGNQRLIFVGGGARTVINNIGRLNATYFLEHGQTDFGLQFHTFRTSRGEFKMIEHPIFNSNPNMRKMAVVVDLPSVKPRYLRPTLNEEYGQDGKYVQDGRDAVGGTLTTELTMEIINPNAFAVIYGLTAAANG